MPEGVGDRGSGSVLVVGAAAAVLVLLTLLLVLAAALTSGARARTAADLAALAGAGKLLEGAAGPTACAEARRVAEANHGRLVQCVAGELADGAPELTVVVAVEPPLVGIPTPAARARAGGVPDPAAG